MTWQALLSLKKISTLLLGVLWTNGHSSLCFKTWCQTTLVLNPYLEHWLRQLPLQLYRNLRKRPIWKLQTIAKNVKQMASVVGFGGSVGGASYWCSGGRWFDPRRVRQHSSVVIDEIFSPAIFSPFRWFKKGQLSVYGERMCTGTG